MKRSINICLISAIISYGLKFLVDIVMYAFMKNEQDSLYFDMWYLFVPQMISTVLIIAFYTMFFGSDFYGLFLKVSTVVLIMSNIIFAILLYFDRQIGYIFYYSIVAAINFLNSLYIKCNIIPARKPGEVEHIPMIFELIAFFCMVVSLYSVFCAFPTLEVTSFSRMWDYYDVFSSMKINILCEIIIAFLFILCKINNAEFIRDNMGETITK